MKASLKINVFTQPNSLLLSITLLFVVVSILHGNSVRAISYPGDFSVFLLKATGGLFFNSGTLDLIRWTTATLPLLLFIYRMMVQLNGYDHYVMFRKKYRSEWWLEKFAAAVLISTLYGLWYILVHGLVGSTLFSLPFDYQIASLADLLRLPVDSIPYRINLIALLLFITGLIALGSLAQIAALVCMRSSSMFLLFTLLLFVSGSLYVQELIPRAFAPLLYPSIFDLFSDGVNHIRIVYALSLNVCIVFICLLAGFFMIRANTFLRRAE